MKFNTRTFLFQLFTGRDNQTADIGRVLWAQVTIGYLIFSAIALFKGGSFDPVAWGGGAAAILGAGGAALGLKGNTEPDGPKKPEKEERKETAG